MNSLRELISRIFRQIFSYKQIEVLRRDLREPVEEKHPSIDVLWELGGAEDVDRLTPDEHNCGEERARELKRQLGLGSKMVIAEHEGEIVHLGFVHFHHLADSGFKIDLASNVCVLHDVRTIERFQGKGLQSAGITRLYEAAVDANANWAVSIVEVSNGVSLRNSVRGGLQVFGRIHAIRILRWFYFVRVPSEVREWCANPREFDAGDLAESA